MKVFGDSWWCSNFILSYLAFRGRVAVSIEK
nr:MAG TPA: hypothetical protein [Caudoviricetes sp.]